jgi:hypothetical protein
MTTEEYDKLYYYNGKSMALKEWAKSREVKTSVLYRRINVLKWSFKKVMEEKIS